jgi:SnoaL-like polyketide cyclase
MPERADAADSSDPVSDLIQQYYRCFNEQRLIDAAALFADDADVELVPGRPERGRAGYLQFAAALKAGFPNATLLVERIEQRNEHMYEVYLLMTGTHRGLFDFGSYRFKATDVEAAFHLRELLEIRDGRILTSVLSLDLNDVVNQLAHIDYERLSESVQRISSLNAALEQATGERRRELANQLGIELDAARRILRPHFYR